MKKSITLALAMISLCGFSYSIDNTKEVFTSNYAKLGISAIPNGTNYSIAPTVTYGKRAIKGYRGVDISMSAGFKDDSMGGGSFANLPQILYLQFFEPEKDNKLYYGVGSAMSVLAMKKFQFFGFTANGCVGYALEKESLPIFAQVDCAIPMLAIKENSDENIDNLIFQFSFGLGF